MALIVDPLSLEDGVEDHAHSIDIYGLVVGLAVGDGTVPVGGRSHNGLHDPFIMGLKSCAAPKITYLSETFFPNQNIVWLEISMENILRMGVLESFKTIPNDV